MKMKNILWYVLDSIFVIVFLIFFFTLSGTDNGTAAWIAFGSILFSYALLLATPLMIKKESASADQSRPLFVISLIYFFLTFLVGLIVIAINPETYTATLLINIAISGVYAFVLVTNLIANEHTSEQEKQRENELIYVKKASASLKSLMLVTRNPELYKTIEKAYDLINTSPAKSNPDVKSLEDKIMKAIVDLTDMDSSTQTSEMIKQLEDITSWAVKRNMTLQLKNRN